jgi:hypothetical protein
MAYFEQINLANEKGTIVNPATEESIILLRRMVKLLESQNATDIGNRQRVTIDAITGSLTLATITTVGTVSAVTAITNALPAGANAIGAITNVQQLAGADQRQFIDVSRTNYNTGIRSRLTFS